MVTVCDDKKETIFESFIEMQLPTSQYSIYTF